MQLIRGLKHLSQQLPQSVVTIGNFDGIHRGHQQLLDRLLAQAKLLKVPAVVITFEPQPQEFFYPQRKLPRLNRLREKYYALQERGVDYLVCLRFNQKLAQCSAEDFVADILVQQLGIKAIIVGDDFRFGAGRAGDLELLEQLSCRYHFQLIQVPLFTVDGQRVSSTRIRHLLLSGDLATANHLLGRRYFLYGVVKRGDQRGRQWGFPTANIRLTDKSVAIDGVYVVQVLGLMGRPLPGVASVGIRPMFANHQRLLEVYLLNFNQDIYGYPIAVEFLGKLRDQQNFASVEQLITQIQRDVHDAEIFFGEENEIAKKFV